MFLYSKDAAEDAERKPFGTAFCNKLDRSGGNAAFVDDVVIPGGEHAAKLFWRASRCFLCAYLIKMKIVLVPADGTVPVFEVAGDQISEPVDFCGIFFRIIVGIFHTFKDGDKTVSAQDLHGFPGGFRIDLPPEELFSTIFHIGAQICDHSIKADLLHARGDIGTAPSRTQKDPVPVLLQLKKGVRCVSGYALFDVQYSTVCIKKYIFSFHLYLSPINPRNAFAEWFSIS